MRNKLLIAFLIFLSPSILGNDYSKRDTTITGNSNISSIIGGFDYTSNYNTFGSVNQATSQPTYSPSISFLGKKGLILSGTYDIIGNSDSTETGTTSEFDLQAGYQWNLTQFLMITPAYTHFFYSNNANTYKSIYSDYANIDISLQTKWLISSVNAGYAWGKKNDLVLSGQAGFNFQIDDFLFHNTSLTFQPTININAANQQFYNQYNYKNYWYLYNYAQNNPEATVADLKEELINHPVLAKALINYFKKRPKQYDKFRKLNSDIVISDLFSEKTKFNFNSWGFRLPLTYSVGNLLFSVGFEAFKPMNQPSYLSSEWYTYVDLGICYSFDFIK
jgi:hypothetical protein